MVGGPYGDSEDPDQYVQTEKLMQQLELAIERGQHRNAALLARELALRKVSCTVNQPKHNRFKEQPIV